jgi:hypothetical protein
MVKYLRAKTSSGSTEVEPSTHHHKVEGLSPAASAGTGRAKMVKYLRAKTSSGSTEVEPSTHHHKVEGLRPATSAGTGRVKMANN